MVTSRTTASACGDRRVARCTSSVLAVGVLALTGCAAVANQEANSSAASSTPSSVTAPRTDAVAAAPHPRPSTTATPPTGEISLGIEDRRDLGEIVVDSMGRTVYVFSKDSANEPTCYDACANTWIPLLAKNDPIGGIGIDVAAADTAPRRDGDDQVTYHGFPLYRYAGDNGSRDANGQGRDMFGGEWHVLTKAGRPLA